jgi:hypothetical protein
MKNKFLLAFLLISFCVSINSLHAQTKNDAFKKIFGRWLRPDGGYVLVIDDVDEYGRLNATYLNPRKINVSKAQTEMEDKRIKIFVELKDRYYPGNYYELTYDKETDRLIGTYYHLGINKEFEVYFLREE